MRLSTIAVFAILCLSLYSNAAVPDEFHFEISPTAEWNMRIDGKVWLQSAPIWFNANNKTCSTEDGTLVFMKSRVDAGTDNIGAWNRTFFTYKCTITNAAIEAQIVTYKDYPIVLFGQNWLSDTYGTSAGSIEKVVSGFPTFQLSNDTARLAYWAPRGYMAGYDKPTAGWWSNADLDLSYGDKVGPITVFPASRSGRAAVISPFSEFMSWSMSHDQERSRVDMGMLGRAEMIPRGMLPFYVLQYGNSGINQLFQDWGSKLQTYWHTDTPGYRQEDYTADYLGYWTDGGACYYYWTETGQTYEQTLLDVKEYADQEKLPYKYMQFDSWWYPKDDNGGMLEWAPMQETFPHGIQSLVNQTGLAASAHIKWWSPKTPLAKQNGGKYDFILEDKMALPVDPNLYDDILAEARKWGVRTLEEDWFGQMWDGLSCLQTNITLASTWMLYMYEGVKRNGMTLQQCTSYPRHVYMGLQIPAVTQQRVSNDYRAGHDQWKIGTTSLWVSALGQAPYKDCFWSTDTVQYCSDKYRGYHETGPEREAIVSVLSTGPVAPADRIGDTDRDLIMQCCRSDGLILKADKPATAIDDMFYEAALGDGKGPLGQVWSTYSQISRHIFGIIFVSQLSQPFSITPDSVGLHLSEDSIIYHRESPSKYVSFSSSQPFLLPKSVDEYKADLYYVVPVFKVGSHEVSVMGELTKWVPMSSARVYQLDVADDDIAVELSGAAHEKVPLWYLIDGKLSMTVCDTDRWQRVTLSVITGQCGRG